VLDHGGLAVLVLRLKAGARAPAARARADEQLAQRTRKVHTADRAYGAPRITAELNDGAPLEQRINHKRVARAMAADDIAGIRLRRRVPTTIPEPSDQVVPDLLQRNCTPRSPTPSTSGTHLPAPR
jgi:helix-turn-helix protein